jgi:TolB-like protein
MKIDANNKIRSWLGAIGLICLLFIVMNGFGGFRRIVPIVDGLKLDPKQVYPIAVLPFSERTKKNSDLGQQTTDLLFANLVARPELLLVDREDMEKVLQEQELNLSGAVNASEATKVGQLTGAKILVTGRVLQVDNTLYLVAKIIGTETTRVVGTSVKGSPRDQLGDLVAKLGDEVSKALVERADALVAKPVTREDRIAAVKKAVGKRAPPSLMVEIRERHVGQENVDPAARPELLLFCTDTGFTVIDSDNGRGKNADIKLVGAGTSEFATRHGNLISVKARLEVSAVEQATGRILAADRQVSVGIDLTEQLASRAALQEAMALIAVRMLPKLVQTADGEEWKRYNF